MDAASDSGRSDSDLVTNATTLILRGSVPLAEAGGQIEVFATLDGTETSWGKVVTNADGSWELTLAAPKQVGAVQDDYALRVAVTDVAGNTGPRSEPQNLTIDRVAPAAPADLELDPDSDTGTLADKLTSQSSPTIVGTAEANSEVELKLGEESLGTVLTDADGAWSLTVNQPLPEGANKIDAYATDVAGNTSLASSVTVTIDTTAPTVSVSGLESTLASDTGTSQTDNLTTNPSPVLVGTAEKNTTVNVYAGAILLGTTVADGDGKWRLDLDAEGQTLPEGVNSLTATATDAAANTSAPSVAKQVEIDTSAFAPPVITGLTTGSDTGYSDYDQVTNIARPVLTGTVAPGARVYVYDGDSPDPIAKVTASETGEWFAVPTFNLSNGVHNLKATALDPAGNESRFSDARSITIDRVAPAMPTFGGLVAATDTGTSDSDRKSGALRPTLMGTGPAGEVVEIFNGATLTGRAVVNPEGKWTFTPDTPFAEGALSLQVQAVDLAGNRSAKTVAVSINLDVTNPSRPAITGISPDTGLSDTDSVTSAVTPTILGTADKGAIVAVYDGTIKLGTATANAQGAWSLPTDEALTAGAHTLSAVAFDAVGNISGVSEVHILEVDQTAPDAPTIVLAASSDTGFNPFDRATNDNTPTLQGRSEPGARVVIFDGSNEIGAAMTDHLGHWSFTPDAAFPLGDGLHTFTARAEDLAGNRGGVSDAIEVDIRTVPPAAPTMTLATGSDTGAIGDGITYNNKPVLTGSTEPGALITILDGSEMIGTARADDEGVWSFLPTKALSVGPHALTATAATVHGNVSDSVALALQVDPAPPGVPAVTGLSAGTDTGSSQTDSMTQLSQPTIVGTAEAGSRVEVFEGDELLGTAVADGDGNWALVLSEPGGPSLDEGVHALTVRASDEAGNQTWGVTPTNIFIDATAPAASPVILGLTPATDSGFDSRDAVTQRLQPTLVGTAEANATVEIFQSGTLIGSAPANANGIWQFTPGEPLTPGTNVFTARAIDLAGNVSPLSGDPADPSVGFVVDVDTTPPETAVLTGLKAGDDTGASDADGVTQLTRPTLLGTAEPGATVIVTRGTTVLGTAPVDADGNWSFRPPAALQSGVNTLQVRVVDSAGNVSAVASETVLTVDTGAPSTAPTLTLALESDGGTVGDGLTNVAKPTFSGIAEPGATVQLADGGQPLGSAQADAVTGAWSFTPTQSLAQGLHRIDAIAVDAAGNVSPPAALALQIDTFGPDAPAIAGLSPATDTGLRSDDGVTRRTDPVLRGTAEPFSTVEVMQGAGVIATVEANAAGYWEATLNLTQGTYDLAVRVIDAAGNTSPTSTPYSVVVDTTGPAVDTKITGLAQGTDTGASAEDFVTRNDRPLLAGTAEAGATVSVFNGPTKLGTVIANDLGNWSLQLDLPQGEHTLTAKTTDRAGNEAENDAIQIVRIDSTPSNAPYGLALGAGADSGSSSSDGLTKIVQPIIVGKAEPLAEVEVLEGATSLGRAPVDADGNWSLTLNTALTQGSHALTARALDVAGNPSALSVPLTVVVDAEAPAAPVVRGLTEASDSGANSADSITSFTQPSLVGTAEPNALVEIYRGAEWLGSTTANQSGNWEWTFTAPLADDVYPITAKATDAAGNVSAPSVAKNVRIDTSAAEVPVITGISQATDSGLSQTDRVTNTGVPTILGTAEANSTVQIFSGATLLGTTVASNSGAWSFTPSQALKDGTQVLKAAYTDQAGNPSSVSETLSVVIDTAAPLVPTNVQLKAGDDTGASASDRETAENRPTLTGKAEAGALIEMLQADAVVGQTTVNPDGTFEVQINQDLAEGRQSLTLRVTDSAGNTSGLTSPLGLTVDTIKPLAPVVRGIAPEDDTGASITDGITSKVSPLVIGTAEPGSKVELILDGVRLESIAVGVDGSWSYRIPNPLSAGSHTVTATATDVAGNVSDQAPTFTVTVDAAAPPVPLITRLAPGSDTGVSDSDRITSATTPTLLGTAEEFATVKIFIDGNPTPIGATQADAIGSWAYTLPTPMTGEISFRVEAVDAAGNKSAQSSAFEVNILDTAPSQPVISGITEATDTGVSNTDGRTTVRTPHFYGTADAGAVIELYDGDELIGRTTADGSGDWLFTATPTRALGSHVIRAVAVDDAGNASPASNALSIIIDSTAPGVPKIDGLSAETDTGVSPRDNRTSEAQPTILGSAEPFAEITVRASDTVLGKVNADAAGRWELTPTSALAAGTYNITASAKDATGNQGPDSVPLALTIDRTGPAAPVVSGLTVSTDTGTSNTDAITANPRPTITGTAEANSVIEVFAGANVIGTTQTNKAGQWFLSVDLPVDASGFSTFEVTARATDLAGNQGAASEVKEITIDLRAPLTSTTIDGILTTSDTGLADEPATSEDRITSNRQPTMFGKAEAGARVDIFDGTINIGFTYADDANAWKFTPTAQLSPGSHTMTAKATDLAGNLSPAATPLALTIDTLPPAPPVIEGLGRDEDTSVLTDDGLNAADGISTHLRPTLVGTAEPLARLQIFQDGVLLGTTQANDAGNWTFRPDLPLEDGTFNFSARATDVAGNQSQPSVVKVITLDTTAPNPPVIQGLTVATDTGASTTDSVSRTLTPAVKGTAEAGSIVKVKLGATVLGETEADASGNWTLALGASLSEGVHQLVATATDAAANTSLESAPLEVEIDLTAPGRPTLTGISSGTDSGLEGDGLTSFRRPEIQGTAPVGSTVTIYDGSVVLGAGVPVLSDGSWTYSPTSDLLNGEHTFTAVATDLAGNVGPRSETLVITVDDRVPTEPRLTGLVAGEDTGALDTDLITRLESPTLQGVADPGVTVTIFRNGSSVDEVVADANGAWSYATDWTEGEYLVALQATSPMGVQSGLSSQRSLLIDITPPDGPVVSGFSKDTDTGLKNDDAITDVLRPTIVGSAEKYATVQVYDGATLLGTAKANEFGEWNLPLTSPLPTDIERTITAVAIDVAGNEGVTSAGKKVLVDLSAPQAPVISGLTPETDTGLVNTDSVTSNARPHLTGTSEPSARVTVYSGATGTAELGSVVADESGNWTLELSGALASGQNILVARATDAAGNTSGLSPQLVVTVINTNTTVPIITGLIAATDSGKLSTDLVTSVEQPTLYGTGDKGGTVTLLLGTGPEPSSLGTTQVDAGGKWEFTVPEALAEGSYIFSVVSSNAAGVSSKASVSKTVTVDRTAPGVVTIGGLDAASDTGTAGDNLTSSAKQNITFTAETKSTVEVYADGYLVGIATENTTSPGTFVYKAAFGPGSYDITARAVDLAGNAGPLSEVGQFVVVSPNKAPTLALAPFSETGISQKDKITLDNTPTLMGSADPGSTVTILKDGVVLGTALAQPSGDWSYKVEDALETGPHIFIAQVTDAAGVTLSSAPATGTITLDATAATVTKVSATSATLAAGAKVAVKVEFSEKVTVNLADGKPTLLLDLDGTTREAVYSTGTGTTGLTFEYFVRGGDTTSDLTYVSTGALKLNGSMITDVAGNAAELTLPELASSSSLGGTSNVVVDGTAFPIDKALVTAVEDGRGQISPTRVTSDTTPTVYGVAPAGAEVEVGRVSGRTFISLGQATADGSGNWTFEVEPDLTATSVLGARIAGSTTTPPAGDSLSVALDTVMKAPTLTLPALNANLSTGRPVFSGATEAHSSVTVYLNGEPVETVRTSATTWSYVPSEPLQDGKYTVTLKAQDAYGNQAEMATGRDFVVDTAAPSQPTISGISAATDLGTSNSDRITSNNKPVFLGTGAEPGSTVKLFLDGTLIGSAKTTTANWSVTPSVLLVNGTHEVVARVEDAAGNLSVASDPLSVTIFKGTPLLTYSGLTSETDTGVSQKDNITSSNQPTLVGTATPGTTVFIKQGAEVYGSTVASEGGQWQFDFAAAEKTLAAGLNTVNISVDDGTGNSQDLAGNKFTAVSAKITVEDFAPYITAITTVTRAKAGGYAAGSIIPIKVTFSDVVHVNSSSGLPAIELETGNVDREAVYVSGTGTTALTFNYVVKPGDDTVDLNYVSQDSLKANVSGYGSIVSASGTPVQVRLPDPGGVGSLANATAGDLTIDAVPPAELPIVVGFEPLSTVDTGVSPTDGITSVQKPGIVIETNKSATDTLTVYLNGTVLAGSESAFAPGKVLFTPTNNLPEGTHVITAQLTDKALNQGPLSQPKQVQIDLTAPAPPVLKGLAPESDTGSSATDNVTKNLRPDIVGTAEAGSTVVVSDGLVTLGTVVADAEGNWRLTPAENLTPGSSLTAVATDRAGNSGLVSTSLRVVADNTPPNAPEVTGLAPASDTGTSTTDNVTKESRPVLKGVVDGAEDGTLVKVFKDGDLLGTTTTSGGQWTFTPPAPWANGEHVIRAQATDRAGNVGPESNPLTVTVDAYVSAPVISSLLASSDTGRSNSDGVTSESRPTLSGTASPLTTIQLFLGDSSDLLGSGSVDAEGKWSIELTTALPAGVQNITAVARNQADAISLRSAPLRIEVDETAPVAPTVVNVESTNARLTAPATYSTADPAPVLVGTAEPLSVVQVFEGANSLGFVQADAAGNWRFNLNLVEERSYGISYKATDAAGNVGPSSPVLAVVYDIAGPTRPDAPNLLAVSDTGSSSTDRLTNDSTPTISGATEPLALVRIFDRVTGGDPVEVGTVRADAVGNWNFTLPPLADGVHTITFRAVDRLGNLSDMSNGLVVTLDTAPPTLPVLSGFTAATDQGASTTDGVTNLATPVLFGTADEGTTIRVSDGQATYEAPVGAGGEWTLPLPEMSNGAYAFTAVAVDAAGNTSAATSIFPAQIDTVAPATPVVEGLAPASDTGVSSNDSNTRDVRPVIVGKAEAFATVLVYGDGAEIARTTADATGRWSIAPNNSLTSGEHVISARAVDRAGNLSNESTTRTVTVSEGTPAAPVIAGLTDITDTGRSEDDGITRTVTPTLQGTALPGSLVQIYQGNLVGTALTDADGNWTFTPTVPLTEARHTFTARVVDLAGNISAESTAFSVTVDLTAPPAGQLTGLTSETDSGAENNDGVTSTTQPTLYGTVESFATVHLLEDGVKLGEAIADEAGAWAITPTLTPGQHNLEIRAIDAAGNVGPRTPLKTIIVDTTGPESPVITGLGNDADDNPTDTGTSAIDGLTIVDQPVFKGLTEPGATVRLLEGDRLLGTTVADAFGVWSITPTEALAPGAHSIVARAVDVAGNESAPSKAFALMIDFSSPNQPEITGLTTITDTGVASDDAITRMTRPAITGKADPVSLVDIFVGGVLAGRTAANEDGDWSFTPEAGKLSEGENSVTARITSRASGLTSDFSEPLLVELDTTAPGKPTFDGLTPETDTGLKISGLTSNTQPVLIGTAEAGALVNIYDGKTALGQVTADGDGNWSLPLLQPLLDGTHTIAAVAQDKAGNFSSSSDAKTFVVDTKVPGVPVVAGLTAATDLGVSPFDGFTSVDMPAITGTAEPLSLVRVYADKTNLLGEATANDAGVWVLNLDAPLAEGEHRLSAIALDGAANASLRSAERIININTSSTSTPEVLGLSTETDTGGDPTDGLTYNARPTIVGLAERGSTVSVFNAGKLIGITTADTETGVWRLTPAAALSDGSNTLTARSENLVGRISDVSDEKEVRIDRLAPSSPTIAGIEDGEGGTLSTGLTGNVAPTLVGKATPETGATVGLTVQVFDGNVLLGTAQADLDGNWKLPLTLAEGSHPLTAVVLDHAGNASKASTVWSLVVDASAPSPPEVLGLAAVSDDGLDAQDLVTSSAKPTLIGRAEPNSRVEVFTGTESLGFVTADTAGNWSLALGPTAFSLTEGGNSITARATDSVGNQSAESLPVVVTVDLTPPAAPEILGLAPASQSPDDDSVSNLEQVTIAGTSEPFAQVEVLSGALVLGRVAAGFDGTWSLPVELSAGLYPLQARAQDLAGRSSGLSTVVNITIDATAPLAATITGLKSPTDTGFSATDGVTSEVRPTFVGKADAGTTLSVYDGTERLGTTVVAADGTWEYTPDLDFESGTRAIWVRAQDAAGNLGPASATRTIVVQTAAPGAPRVLGLTEATDDGVSKTDGITSQVSPMLTGVTEPSTRVEVFDGPTSLGIAQADAQGVWTFNLKNPNGSGLAIALTPGEHQFTARAINLAGVVGDASETPYTVTVVSAPTEAPANLALANGSDTGLDDTDRITALARPTITGSASPLVSVRIYNNDLQIGVTQADANGVWVFTPEQDLSEGAHRITAREVSANNALGPVSPVSLTFSVDRTAPIRPAITSVQVDSGSGAEGGVTGDNAPTLVGTGETGTRVQLFDGDTVLGEATVVSGQWTIAVPALENGSHAFTLIATDTAGNRSTSQAPRVLIVDATVPAVPQVWGLTPETDTGLSNSDGITEQTRPTLRGVARPGIRVEVFREDTDETLIPLGHTTANAEGVWELIPNSPLPVGVHEVVARSVATTGATSANSAAVTLEVRSGTPTTPVIDGLLPATDTGLPDGVTSIVRPTLVGRNAPVGSRVQITRGEDVLATVIPDADGKWTFTPDEDWEEGPHTLQAVAINEVDRQSPASAPFDVLIDKTTPDAATNLALSLESDTGESQTDAITSTLQPVLAGTAEPLAVVVAKLGDTRLTTTVEADGTWQLNLPELPEGSHSVNVQVLDLAGNLSQAAPFFSFIVDSSAPDKPVIAGLTPATDTGASDDDGVTSLTRPVLMGRAEPEAMVGIYEGEALLGFARANDVGLWTLEIELASGEHDLIAKATDRAGNTSQDSDAFRVEIVPEGPVPYRVGSDEPISLWLGDFESETIYEGQSPLPSVLPLGLQDVLVLPSDVEWKKGLLLNPSAALAPDEIDRAARGDSPDVPVVVPPEVASVPLHHEWFKDFV
ncbi:MAG: Ig-like domain-containing protein [Candidatus Sericytochromatia bacterium]|nr:Ig-like domain-containing protein [Candidatus Sericytochromatia bacterium]